jgi:hypothetical protein
VLHAGVLCAPKRELRSGERIAGIRGSHFVPNNGGESRVLLRTPCFALFQLVKFF